MTRTDKNILATVVLITATLMGYMEMVAQSVCPRSLSDTVYEINQQREINVAIKSVANETLPNVILRAETPELKVHTGEYHTVKFSLENKADAPVTVRILANCMPTVFNNYFEHSKNFCFSKESLNAHETKRISARFVINPQLPMGYEAGGVDISYTVVGS
jgi:cytochrome c oxidase assembly protein subunit 11